MSSVLPRLNDDDSNAVVDAQIRFLREAACSPLPQGRDVLVIGVHAPAESCERVLRVIPRDMGFLWRSPHGKIIAGGGCVYRIDAQRADRFARFAKITPRFFERVLVRQVDGLDVSPTLVGGVSFVPDVPPIEPWTEFGGGAFSFPRWGYGRQREVAYLTLALRRDELAQPAVVEGYMAQARSILAALESESATSLIERQDISRSSVHNMSMEDWCEYIDHVKRAIASGEFQKIVAARRCIVDLQKSLDDTGFMARLFAAYPECTHFAIRRDHSTFLGATPETLFSKVGREVKTHALAGTTRIKDDPMFDSSGDAAALRRSAKDLAEHEIVVELICDHLGPLCEQIRCAPAPEARRVRNLVHLQTPISATLKEGVTAFDLLPALHPTPAVGGFPTREAALWLRDNEPLERGWYTGTLGWIDAKGNAEFAVAIRCGVLTADRAHIYAGAGVVEKSDPVSEYRETGAKLHPILRALGVAI